MSYILVIWLLAPIWWPISLLRRLISAKPKRIVILEIAGIGDVVCSAHLFTQLRAQYPKARIDLVVDPVAASIAQALPMLDQVIEFPYAQQRGLLGRLRLARLCMSYDTGLCLIPSAAQLTAFCIAALPWRLAVMPSPLNRSYAFLQPLMSSVIRHKTGFSFLATQAMLFQKIGVASAFPKKQLPKVLAKITDPLLVKATTQGTIGILVGSGRSLKRLTHHQLVSTVVDLLTKIDINPDLNVVMLGGPGDRAVAQKIIDAVEPGLRQRIIDTTGTYSLAVLPALLSEMRLVIGVDSGVTHMADALGVPIVCIAGPVDLNEVYVPGEGREFITMSPKCYPCSSVFDTPIACKTGTLACLQFDQEMLSKAVNKLLAAKEATS